MRLSIEYCNAWNYLPRAARLASDILERYGNAISELTLIPSGGGVFEIQKNGELIFSKKQLNRFPEEGEIFKSIDWSIKRGIIIC